LEMQRISHSAKRRKAILKQGVYETGWVGGAKLGAGGLIRGEKRTTEGVLYCGA